MKISVNCTFLGKFQPSVYLVRLRTEIEKKELYTESPLASKHIAGMLDIRTGYFLPFALVILCTMLYQRAYKNEYFKVAFDKNISDNNFDLGEKLNSSDSPYHDLILISWVKISRSCTVFFKKSVNFIILTFYFLSGQTWQYVPYYILPDNKINDWVCSSGFLWIQKKFAWDQRKPDEETQSSILLLGGLV